MFFQTANGSFKTSWGLEKAVQGLTEVYMNEDLFYRDGYKLTLTNSANDLIPFRATSEIKNYMQIGLTQMDDL